MSVKIQTWIEIIHCLQWGHFHICTVTWAVFVLSRHRRGLSLIRVFVVHIQKPWVLSYPLSTHPSHSPSLIRVFVVRIQKPWVLSYPLSAHPSHSHSLIRIFVVRIRKPYILSYPLSAHPRLIRIFAVRIKKPTLPCQGLEMITLIIYSPWLQTSFLLISDYLENPVLEVLSKFSTSHNTANIYGSGAGSY